MSEATLSVQSKSGEAVLYMALELSETTWKVLFVVASGRRRERNVGARDLAALLGEVRLAKERLQLAADARVVSCYEAGRDGFWLDRALRHHGIENVVIDSSSIEVPRRSRRRKTDRVDVGKLMAPLGRFLQRDLQFEGERLALVAEQLAALKRERDAMIAAAREGAAFKARQLMRLGAVAWASSFVFATEFFGWRSFANRRELAGAVGLVPTPYQSGSIDREQGVSKAGNRRMRSMLVEIAWCWLRYQPQSGLARWWQLRFGASSGRMRKIAIVALARKLLVAFWRYLEHGIVPEDAKLKAEVAA